MQLAITTCDVPGCRDSYTIECYKSIPPNHPSEKWITAAGFSICPSHNQAIKLILSDLGFDIKKFFSKIAPPHPNHTQMKTDADFLRWIANRMIEVHKEHPGQDFILKLRTIADKL